MLESIRTEEVSDWLLGQTSACRALKLTVVQKSGLPMTPENSRVEKVNFISSDVAGASILANSLLRRNKMPPPATTTAAGQVG
jgi:hypothetical protein